MEGSDPTTYELIHKVQALQRRLLATTEAVAAGEAALSDKQALIAQLKAQLERSPGPDAAAELISSQVKCCLQGMQLNRPCGECQQTWGACSNCINQTCQAHSSMASQPRVATERACGL